MFVDELIQFCKEKSKNIKLKAETQVFVEIAEKLEKFQQYKAIGTVEDIKLIFSLCKDLQDVIKQYEAIGTIGEFKALKEKNTKKRFNIFESHGMRQFVCGCCDRPILTTDNYCSFCGQKFDWQ